MGEAVGNPAGAFVVGVISHFILDSIPHFDNLDNECFSPRQIAFTATDLIVAFLLMFFVVKLPLNETIFSSSYAWGALGGFLPDMFDNVPFWKKQFLATRFGKAYHRLHAGVHRKQPSALVGMTTQLVVITLFLAAHFAIIK
ncbi:hypothetical protein COT78_01780 [Candidatus Berkelbacteria bacterium CG10_big_fil_rev_8_21_14_0_10_43_13]|uniref:Uncharacterized protein n=1 Tax=Candidatus Berkelbacteria bacterium CG10_big_fil_rev_8_21_14_0_10_43_13 TaxID=1974514 RepID=A0A2H0W6R1_9BACT|nr:MAG: hypothetical protein COT78_01780 [Candidatus Berkelbacteria bacterium CG10_big_fil_rev_8_21_14_0_10_43_13]